MALAAFAAVANSAAALLEAAGAANWSTRRGPAVVPYLLGLALDVLGWLLSLTALRFLPIFAVQAIVAEQVAITVLAGGRAFGSATRARDVAAAVATVVGLAVIAASAAPERAPHPPTGVIPVLLAVLAVGVVLGAFWLRTRLWLVATLLAGGCFGTAAVLARALNVRFGSVDELGNLAREPSFWLLGALGLAGTLLYLWALAIGNAGAVLAVLSVTEVVLPGTAGVVLLGDDVRPGWELPCLLALCIALTGTAVLARSPATSRRPARRR
ncbi:hypothetical protein [Pseudonocardia acaciae]|uniref:hypothetical protein n=1 Tax=Pseudonocardia acaciae TaxID=551276 RepID=UPI00048B921F|nr:hypothetical protein [Pseudonocardia acaciae]